MTSDTIGRTSCAAVFHATGLPFVFENFQIPELRGRETLVRVRCCTICGSDLHSYFGRRLSPTPSVLGHEMVGEVDGLGPEGPCDYRGRRLALGDRVTWSMVWSCGECFYCRHGLRPKCEHLLKFGHEAITHPGHALTGGIAEHCHLPEATAIFRIPPHVPDVVASPANCATATVSAVFRNAGPVEGKIAVIAGAGMLGLTACAMAAYRGAAEVIAIEPDPRRRARALLFGATAALDSTLPTAAIVDEVRRRSAGRGADLALEFSGLPEACESTLGLVRPGGRVVMAGATFPARPMQIAAEQVVRSMLQITGIYNYEPVDLESALEFLAQAGGRFPFETLVGKTFPLRDVNQAMQYAETERPPRVALIP